MKVFGARCIVKEEKQSNKTSTGIIIQGKEKEPTYRGKIVAVGNGAMLENGTRVPMDVKVGDTVLYAAFAGSPVENNGETFVILNERDILCVLD